MAACPPSKDRDSANVLSAGAAVSAGVSSHHGFKTRNKSLAPKSDPLNSNKRLQKKETEVRLDNLQDAELQALLDEVVQYRGKKDGEKQTELFQALLRETQESGEESPPAFRPTPQYSHSQPAQHKRRRSRKECSCLFSGSAGVPSTPNTGTSVAGSNRKGGSLQNISHTGQSNSHQVSRNRKRHDTSDSWGVLPGSPRKREGGSLPCDVARGSKKLEAEPHQSSESIPVMGVGETEHSPQSSSKDFIIDMGEVVHNNLSTSAPHTEEKQDRFSEPWKLRLPTTSTHSNSTGCVEPMEQDFGSKSYNSTEADAAASKKLLPINKKLTNSSRGGAYGSLASKSTVEEVDARIPFNLDQSVAGLVNGTPNDERTTQRSFRRNGVGGDSVMDENGNPTLPQLTNGPSLQSNTIQQQSRTSPTLSSVATSASAPPPPQPTSNGGNSVSSIRLAIRPKAKKKAKDSDAVLSDNLPGHLGNLDVNELLEYIESSEGKRNALSGNGETGRKNNGAKNNNNGGHCSNRDATTKVKAKEKKSTKTARPTEVAVRQEDSTEDSDTADQFSSNEVQNFDFPIRGVVEISVESEEVESSQAATDFQTVMKKQRRKKRNNSIGTSSMGNSSVPNGRKELFDANMSLFYTSTASSPSRHRQRRQQTSATGSGPEMKKLVASVPPSEPSDVDSDGDSVHSLPIQPSGPLFPSLPAPTSTPTTPLLIPSANTTPSAWTAVSYADIIRSEHGRSDVSFIADSSQPVDIKSSLDPSILCANVVNVPCPQISAPVAAVANAAAPLRGAFSKSRGGRVPLRRAASLPPTSPSVDTPPVVIIGASSTTEVDVTFGFELNEQLLALSSSVAESKNQTLAKPPGPPVPTAESPAPDQATISPAEPKVRPDFAARYRERPDLASPQLSQRTIEIVDFISQAWSRIQRKLEEQSKQQEINVNGGGLPSQTSIRVYYTLE